MTFKPQSLDGVYLIDLEKREDERGFFARLYCSNEFSAHGLEFQWLQINSSFTKKKGVVRGMHFQHPPHAEAKMVRCLRGKIFDVIVDLRYGSLSFGEWISVELSEDNRSMLYVPKGFAHGFQTLSEKVEVLYFHTEHYVPESEGGVNYLDSDLSINWPSEITAVSARDSKLPELKHVGPIKLS